jgi:hypothetical protein
MKMIVEKQMEGRLAGETEVLGENLPQRHFCPSEAFVRHIFYVLHLWLMTYSFNNFSLKMRYI